MKKIISHKKHCSVKSGAFYILLYGKSLCCGLMGKPLGVYVCFCAESFWWLTSMKHKSLAHV